MIAVLAALIGLGLGGALGLGFGLVLLRALGVGDFEGKRAMTAAFFVAPVGALAGMGLALWLAVRVAGPPGVGGVVGTLLALAALGAAAGVSLRLRSPLGRNRAAPRLHLEVRTPPDAGTVSAELACPQGTMVATFRPEGARLESGARITPGMVELYHRSARRVLALRTGTGSLHHFSLPLRANPAASAGWSDWHAPDGNPPASADLALRWRVEV